jgi:hypothetical protein
MVEVDLYFTAFAFFSGDNDYAIGTLAAIKDGGICTS